MKNYIKRLFLKKALDLAPIGNINPAERKAGESLQTLQACALEIKVVVIIQIVYAVNLLSALQQEFSCCRPDKPCGACDQYRYHTKFRSLPVNDLRSLSKYTCYILYNAEKRLGVSDRSVDSKIMYQSKEATAFTSHRTAF